MKHKVALVLMFIICLAPFAFAQLPLLPGGAPFGMVHDEENNRYTDGAGNRYDWDPDKNAHVYTHTRGYDAYRDGTGTIVQYSPSGAELGLMYNDPVNGEIGISVGMGDYHMIMREWDAWTPPTLPTTTPSSDPEEREVVRLGLGTGYTAPTQTGGQSGTSGQTSTDESALHIYIFRDITINGREYKAGDIIVGVDDDDPLWAAMDAANTEMHDASGVQGAVRLSGVSLSALQRWSNEHPNAIFYNQENIDTDGYLLDREGARVNDANGNPIRVGLMGVGFIDVKDSSTWDGRTRTDQRNIERVTVGGVAGIETETRSFDCSKDPCVEIPGSARRQGATFAGGTRDTVSKGVYVWDGSTNNFIGQIVTGFADNGVDYDQWEVRDKDNSVVSRTRNGRIELVGVTADNLAGFMEGKGPGDMVQNGQLTGDGALAATRMMCGDACKTNGQWDDGKVARAYDANYVQQVNEGAFLNMFDAWGYMRTGQVLGRFMHGYNQFQGLARMGDLFSPWWTDYWADVRKTITDNFCILTGSRCLTSMFCGEISSFSSSAAEGVLVGVGPGGTPVPHAFVKAEKSAPIRFAGMTRQQLVDMFPNGAVVEGQLYNFSDPNVNIERLPTVELRLYHAQFMVQNLMDRVEGAHSAKLPYNIEFRVMSGEQTLLSRAWYPAHKELGFGERAADRLVAYSGTDYNKICIDFGDKSVYQDTRTWFPSKTSEHCDDIAIKIGDPTDPTPPPGTNPPSTAGGAGII